MLTENVTCIGTAHSNSVFSKCSLSENCLAATLPILDLPTGFLSSSVSPPPQFEGSHFVRVLRQSDRPHLSSASFVKSPFRDDGAAIC